MPFPKTLICWQAPPVSHPISQRTDVRVVQMARIILSAASWRNAQEWADTLADRVFTIQTDYLTPLGLTWADIGVIPIYCQNWLETEPEKGPILFRNSLDAVIAQNPDVVRASVNNSSPLIVNGRSRARENCGQFADRLRYRLGADLFALVEPVWDEEIGFSLDNSLPRQSALGYDPAKYPADIGWLSAIDGGDNEIGGTAWSATNPADPRYTTELVTKDQTLEAFLANFIRRSGETYDGLGGGFWYNGTLAWNFSNNITLGVPEVLAHLRILNHDYGLGCLMEAIRKHNPAAVGSNYDTYGAGTDAAPDLKIYDRRYNLPAPQLGLSAPVLYALKNVSLASDSPPSAWNAVFGTTQIGDMTTDVDALSLARNIRLLDTVLAAHGGDGSKIRPWLPGPLYDDSAGAAQWRFTPSSLSYLSGNEQYVWTINLLAETLKACWARGVNTGILWTGLTSTASWNALNEAITLALAALAGADPRSRMPERQNRNTDRQ